MSGRENILAPVAQKRQYTKTGAPARIPACAAHGVCGNAAGNKNSRRETLPLT